MVLGVGIDIVKIEKMKKAIERWGDDFLKRVFNQEEIENIFKGKIYYQRLAARFAAKEAIIKALSKKKILALKDILILNRKNGAPYCRFKKKVGLEVFLSLTHIEDYAIACAVVQKKT
jgi:holo-[acyl-carrier protein] synthase